MIVVNQRKERQLRIFMKLRSVVGLLWLRGRNNSQGLRIRQTELFVASAWGGGGGGISPFIHGCKSYLAILGAGDILGRAGGSFIHGCKSYLAILGAGDILGRAGGSYTYLPDRAGDHKS